MGKAEKHTRAGFRVVGTKLEVGCSPQDVTNGLDETMREPHNPSMHEGLLVWADGKEDTGSGHRGREWPGQKSMLSLRKERSSRVHAQSLHKLFYTELHCTIW